MEKPIIPSPVSSIAIRDAARQANDKATSLVFAEFLAKRSENTRLRYKQDLNLFADYLKSNINYWPPLYYSPTYWSDITWGLVKDFQHWQAGQGYTYHTIDGRLSTIKVFARLAFQAGCMPEDEYLKIKGIEGVTGKAEINLNKEREKRNIPVRIGFKKAEPTPITDKDFEFMKSVQPKTPKGARNHLLLCLLGDHGLRVSEAASLTRKSFDKDNPVVMVYREKVNKHQKLELSKDSQRALSAYWNHVPAQGIIWRRSRKMKGELGKQIREKSAERTMYDWLHAMGLQIGLNISPHDLRHYSITYEFNHETPLDRIMDAHGHSDSNTTLKYKIKDEIANRGTARLKEK